MRTGHSLKNKEIATRTFVLLRPEMSAKGQIDLDETSDNEATAADLRHVKEVRRRVSEANSKKPKRTKPSRIIALWEQNTWENKK